MDATIRRATLDDAPAVIDFTRDTWPEREGGDYVPDVFEDWVETDDETQRTLVAEADGVVAGLVRVTFLSDYEAWCQGIRVRPDYRNSGIATRLNHAAFDWARERGATVARNLVFSWNVGGLVLSRATGFEPVAEFRWTHPDPDPDADPEAGVAADPDAAWTYWGTSGARTALAGLALDLDESWALAELTRERLARAADETRLLVVRRDGARGFAYRVRDYERDGERWAEYGVGAWADPDAARSLFDAVRRDAAAIDADRTRLLIPETPRSVSDAAAAGADPDPEPDFVHAADLTRPASSFQS